MDKIYSRTRLSLPKITQTFHRNNIPNRSEKRNRKIFFLILILVIAIFTTSTILRSISPIIEKLCQDKAKNIATKISNEQATIVMMNYQYEDLVTITKDSSGNVKMIKANVIPINEIISDIPVKMLEAFKNEQYSRFTIPLGSFTGIRMLSRIWT